MRILFLGFNRGPFGPPDVIWQRTAKDAISMGHQVFVSTDNWGRKNAEEFIELQQAGAKIYYRNRGPRLENFWLRLMHKGVRKLPLDFTGQWKRLLSSCRPDVIVINDPSLCTFIGWAGLPQTLLDSDVPIVTICHGIEERGALSPELYHFAPQLFAKTAANIFVSNRNLETARRQLCQPLGRAVVIDNPPSFKELSALPYPTTPTFKMATVARLDCGGKGQDLVIEILSRKEWKDRDWSLTIAGAGPDGGYLNDLVRYHGLEERIHLIGHCNDIRKLWAEHCLFVLCTAAEGKPLALTEAMVCGRPSIVTDVGGNAELIEDEERGFVAESATIKSFAATMERAWEKRAQWRGMGENSHAFILERLAIPPEKQLFQLIQSIVTTQGGSLAITKEYAAT